MKKKFKLGCLTIVGLLVLIGVIGVIVDGDDGADSGATPSSGSQAAPGGGSGDSASPTVFAVGDRIELGDYAYTVHGHQIASVIGHPVMLSGAKAGPGATFVIVEYTIENLTNETQTVKTDDLQLLDGQGRKFFSSSEATTALLTEDGQDFLFSELQPGLPKRTKTAFTVPQNAISGELKILIPEKGFFSSGEAIVKIK